VSILKS